MKKKKKKKINFINQKSIKNKKMNGNQKKEIKNKKNKNKKYNKIFIRDHLLLFRIWVLIQVSFKEITQIFYFLNHYLNHTKLKSFQKHYQLIKRLEANSNNFNNNNNNINNNNNFNNRNNNNNNNNKNKKVKKYKKMMSKKKRI